VAGISALQIGFCERGDNVPKLTLILRIARALSVRPGELLDDIKTPKRLGLSGHRRCDHRAVGEHSCDPDFTRAPLLRAEVRHHGAEVRRRGASFRHVPDGVACVSTRVAPPANIVDRASTPFGARAPVSETRALPEPSVRHRYPRAHLC
jgi:hypothetical protein